MLWRVSKFSRQKIFQRRGELNPNLRINAEFSPFWARGPAICFPMFWNIGAGGIDHFSILYKVYIWTANGAQA